MSTILIGQSAWVPGLATNPYQQLQNLIYLFNIVVDKIKSGDPEGIGLIGELPEDVQYGEMLVAQVGGSSPQMVSAWNAVVGKLAEVGVSANIAARAVEGGYEGVARETTITLGGQVPISSPASSGELFKSISPVPSPAGDELVYIFDSRQAQRHLSPPQAGLTSFSGLGLVALLAAGLYFMRRRR